MNRQREPQEGLCRQWQMLESSVGLLTIVRSLTPGWTEARDRVLTLTLSGTRALGHPNVGVRHEVV